MSHVYIYLALRLHGLLHRIGRRGASLLFLAILDFIIAATMHDIETLPDSLKVNYYGLTRFIPLSIWADIWLCVGLLCFIQAFSKRDRLAYSLAAGLKFAWATGFVLTAVYYPQAPRANVNAAVWYMFGLFVLLHAGWEENSNVRS